MSEAISMRDLSDQVLVGGAGCGADFLQNMYGMWVRAEKAVAPTHGTNLEVAVEAHHVNLKPVVTTSLDYTPARDGITKEALLQCTTDRRYLIRRDWKDALVQVWQTFEPEMSWEGFRDSSLGLSMVAEFESAVSDVVFENEISYEELVAEPQRVLMDFVFSVLPQQDNPAVVNYGEKKEEIDLGCIDVAVEKSEVRSLREWSDSGLVEKVGIWKEFLSPAQAEEIDEFVASL